VLFTVARQGTNWGNLAIARSSARMPRSLCRLSSSATQHTRRPPRDSEARRNRRLKMPAAPSGSVSTLLAALWQRVNHLSKRRIHVPKQTTTPPSNPPQDSDGEHRLDRRIASLRHSVECDPQGEPAPEREAGRSGKGARKPPMRLDGVLRHGWRAVRERRFEIGFYGLCVASAVVAAWLISAHG
jgi:hypothetical protein